MGIHITLTLIGLAVWLYLLSVCKRGQLNFYHFIIGSIGAFIIAMSYVAYYEDLVVGLFIRILAPIGNLTGMYESYIERGLFFINNNEMAMSFYIDLECSGIIEMLVFVCLLAFFQVYTRKEKIVTAIIGVALIIIFNCIRMITILAMIYFGGQEYYLIAHSVVGRLIFYVLTIILYYNVFTKKQINKQKVGAFAYESSVLN